jgi:bacteriorhodopsin
MHECMCGIGAGDELEEWLVTPAMVAVVYCLLPLQKKVTTSLAGAWMSNHMPTAKLSSIRGLHDHYMQKGEASALCRHVHVR